MLRCGLQSAICSGTKVKFKHRGACIDQAGNRIQNAEEKFAQSNSFVNIVSGVASCAAEKQRALVAGSESGIPVFVPSCREDGSYKQIQCHEGPIHHYKTSCPSVLPFFSSYHCKAS